MLDFTLSILLAMFKLCVALCLAVAMAKSCPDNSKATSHPVMKMSDCACTTGFKAYAFPGWGCYKSAKVFACPKNSAVKSSLTHSTKFADCDCNEGFVAMGGKCV